MKGWNSRQMITAATLTGQERLRPVCVKDLGWRGDGKHCKMSLNCNFMTQKVNKIIGIIKKSIISKMRTFNTTAKFIY